MTEQREVIIPPEAHVRCPLRQFHLVRASGCDGCAEFRGLTEMMGGEHIPFERRFTVRCAFPTNRELFHVE